MVVGFTRDYEEIRKELTELEHYDKTCVEPVLQAINGILTGTWGTQNYCQVLMVTDCGIGMRSSSVLEIVEGLIKRKQTNDESYNWLPFACPSSINICCLGNPADSGFRNGTALYQNMLDYSGQPGKLYLPKCEDLFNHDPSFVQKQIVSGMCQQMCEASYKPFEATLNCGTYFKLESSVLIWPPPLPYKEVDLLGSETMRTISKQLDICGFISISDIGSPMSISRHLVLPKATATETSPAEDHRRAEGPSAHKKPKSTFDLEQLDADIKNFYAKSEANSDDESVASAPGNTDESMCVLLHGALKVENMAALVLLNQNWFGFLYSYADNKKKSNLMLMVLKPGPDVIPWLGDLRLLTTANDQSAEIGNFPVKPDKRSYSQNCVSWIRQAGLQSDIQKVLRHGKKLPEKTQHFYKELNRIRKAALSLGFVELLDGLASIFERELLSLQSTANPECALQLKHASVEIRSNRDLKKSIVPYSQKY